MVSKCVIVFCAQTYYFFKLFRLLPCGPCLPIPNPSLFVLLTYTMGQGAGKKRKEEAKVRKWQTGSAASAVSALPPASTESNLPKKRGCPRKNPVETIPPRSLPCHTTHSTNTTLSTSGDVLSDISEPDDKLPIETIASGILQTSVGSGDSEISSADSDSSDSISNPSDVEDIIDVDDGSESDESILVVAKKSGRPGKAAKKPPNARQKVAKTATSDGM